MATNRQTQAASSLLGAIAPLAAPRLSVTNSSPCWFGVSELLRRQIERLETSIDLSTDWLEVQYLMSELDDLKAMYASEDAEAA